MGSRKRSNNVEHCLIRKRAVVEIMLETSLLLDARPFAPYKEMSCVHEALFADDVAYVVAPVLDCAFGTIATNETLD